MSTHLIYIHNGQAYELVVVIVVVVVVILTAMCASTLKWVHLWAQTEPSLSSGMSREWPLERDIIQFTYV